jgi:predicted PurR-regulated permease PerM
VFNLVLALAFSIYILAQKETIGRQVKKLLRALLPNKAAENLLELSSLTHLSFARFVSGQMTEAVIIGLLCFIGMLIFGFPYAGVISVMVGFTALIPIFGAFIGTGIGAFLILLTNPIQAIWFVIFIIVLQQLEGNLIYPKVVGRSIGLPGIWVLLAVTVGGNAWSLPGMLLAVPLSSVVYTLLRRFVNRRFQKSSPSEQSLDK